MHPMLALSVHLTFSAPEINHLARKWLLYERLSSMEYGNFDSASFASNDIERLREEWSMRVEMKTRAVLLEIDFRDRAMPQDAFMM
jgi:hypothetical protein